MINLLVSLTAILIFVWWYFIRKRHLIQLKVVLHIALAKIIRNSLSAISIFMYYAMQFGYCSLHYVGVLKYHSVPQRLSECYWYVYLLFPYTWHPQWLMGAMCTDPPKTLIPRWVEHPRIDIRGPNPSPKLVLQTFPLISSHLVEKKKRAEI